MPDVKDDCWRRLKMAIALEGEQTGGHGKVIFEITYFEGEPRQMLVLERKPSYRLDRGAVDTGPVQG